MPARNAMAISSDMTQAIVEAAHVSPGMRVLDIACGTGEPAISLANALADDGEVVGVDVSPAPLKIAENRACGAGIDSTGRKLKPARIATPPLSLPRKR
jgi:ubiquinone/menaquinone biosynthesis C-methylase UbiE